MSGLLEHGSPTRAAFSAGVSERTVRRWLALEVFGAEYRRRSRTLADEAHSDLLAAQRQAVAALREGMSSGSPATRVRAARAVLELAARLTDEDTERRIRELERRATSWPHATTALGLIS
jgi:threonine synthase